jgi:glycosyltransferase involved in cell wall biosynthesis
MNTKISLAYLDCSNFFSGAEVSLESLVSHLDKQAFEPILYFIYPKGHQDRYNHLGCKTRFLLDQPKWWTGSDYWKKPIRGTDALKRNILGIRLAYNLLRDDVQILHINLARNDIFWYMFWPKIIGVKVILHCRSDDMNWIPNRYIQAMSNHIIAVSDFVKKKVLLKNTKARVSTIYNSVVFPEVGFQSQKKKIAKKNLNIDDNTLLVSSVGLLSEHKGHDTAIRVFKRLCSSYPSMRLFISGGGSQEELLRLQGITSELNIADLVYFSGDQIRNIEDVYRASELVFSLTKRGEAFGRVPFESMSFGTPVLAPNMGGASELITDGETGYLVNSQNLDEVVQRAKEILDNPTKAQKVVEAGRMVFKQRLSTLVSTSQVQQVYRESLKS